MKGLALLVLLCLVPVTASAQYVRLDDGRDIRVMFPTNDRAVAQAGWSAMEGKASFGAEIRFGAAVDFPDEAIWWRLKHRLLPIRYNGAQGVNATLIRGDYWRHDVSSFVLVPGDLNLKFPAPFDIHVGYRALAADWDFGVEQGSLDTLMFDVSADFVRDADFRSRVALGLSGGHQLLVGQQTTHRLVPLSGLALNAGWDSKDGRKRAELRTECNYGVALEEAAPWSWECVGNAEIEWVFAAINDTPVSLPISGGWKWRDGNSEWQIDVGVRWSLPLAN